MLIILTKAKPVTRFTAVTTLTIYTNTPNVYKSHDIYIHNSNSENFAFKRLSRPLTTNSTPTHSSSIRTVFTLHGFPPPQQSNPNTPISHFNRPDSTPSSPTRPT